MQYQNITSNNAQNTSFNIPPNSLLTKYPNTQLNTNFNLVTLSVIYKTITKYTNCTDRNNAKKKLKWPNHIISQLWFSWMEDTFFVMLQGLLLLSGNTWYLSKLIVQACG
jgi:hypothetical protein